VVRRGNQCTSCAMVNERRKCGGQVDRRVVGAGGVRDWHARWSYAGGLLAVQTPDMLQNRTQEVKCEQFN
jgi:hypothetical protein